jgi:hydrogenase expression/formation protein HypE
MGRLFVDKPFPLGKLPADYLARLLSRFPIDDPRVILGPQVGEDAAVIAMGDRYLVAKSDPITFATDAIGWYAVHVNANDVACTGATPGWFLATLLLPEGQADAKMVDAIFTQMDRACQELGATLVGGHTEITYGLDRPLLVGAMLGEVAPERLVTTGGARPGDVVLLTKQVAVEATAIIAREKRDELLQAHGLSAGYVGRCADFLYQPGISVVREAQIAVATTTIHAMHDPTEGGLVTGLWELASAAHVGLEIDAQAVPVYPETRRLCDTYGLNPWGTIGSGSLLLALDVDDAEQVCDALSEAGIEVATIGRVTTKERGVVVRQAKGQTVALPTFARDEIARLFE